MGYTLKIYLNLAYSRTPVHCELQICEFSLTHEGKQFSYLKKSIICVELKSIASRGIREELKDQLCKYFFMHIHMQVHNLLFLF